MARCSATVSGQKLFTYCHDRDHVVICRLFEEQSQDPSIVYIVAIFVLLFTMYFARRCLRNPYALGNGDIGRKELTLEQVRMLQQMKYGGQVDGNGKGYDSDSSSALAEEDEIERFQVERDNEIMEPAIGTTNDE